MKLKNSVVVGFGISNRETFQDVCQFANGAIIGSAFVRLLEQEGCQDSLISEFIIDIKGK